MLLSRLHVHAVTSCHSIICDRRRLERVPKPNHSSPPEFLLFFTSTTEILCAPFCALTLKFFSELVVAAPCERRVPSKPRPMVVFIIITLVDVMIVIVAVVVLVVVMTAVWWWCTTINTSPNCVLGPQSDAAAVWLLERTAAVAGRMWDGAPSLISLYA